MWRPICSPVTTVTSESTGFKNFEGKRNKVDSNSALSLDATRNVTDVEVAATAGVLCTDSSAVHTEVTGEQVDLQKLNGRNPLYIAQLLPVYAADRPRATSILRWEAAFPLALTEPSPGHRPYDSMGRRPSVTGVK